ncbi:hypothetical protein ABVK25_010680 [Lepraria finkii]|uniref:Uncharacterized protein n=1 Tax=Lepraria finkii TaxID=1340010 RepID=A0ABR4AWR4_9LECA
MRFPIIHNFSILPFLLTLTALNTTSPLLTNSTNTPIHCRIPGTTISLDIENHPSQPFLPPIDMQTALILGMDDAYTRHKQETLENNRLEAVFGRVKVVVEGRWDRGRGVVF